MTVPYLPEDCIYYILKYLKFRRPTLFNCLLVNRFWCKATVPLLYADPFQFPISKNNSLILLSTLILCFNKSEILQLKNQLKLANINDKININDKDKPLFEYLKYLENFDDLKFKNSVSSWLNLPYDLPNSFVPIFYQSILRQCNKLNTLRLGGPIAKYSEISQGFLDNIMNNYLNLKKLKISLSKSVSSTIKEKFCSVIQRQNNLKVFELSIYCSDNIFSSLQFQKYSLVYIRFYYVNFSNISFKNFLSLCNLKYLKFDYCKGLTLDQYENLKYASFKLEGLYSRSCHNNFITHSVIKYLGKSLKELILTEPLKFPEIIKNISIYCPDLITLEIRLRLDTDLLVFSYFKNLKIRILSIVDYLGCNTSNIRDIQNLANNLHNIKEVSLRFFGPYKFLKLKTFLENCHEYLEVINLSYSIELELLEIILNYTERNENSLRLLGVKMEPNKVLNDEELKLLNQIKAKGVKLVEFDSIYKHQYYEVI